MTADTIEGCGGRVVGERWHIDADRADESGGTGAGIDCLEIGCGVVAGRVEDLAIDSKKPYECGLASRAIDLDQGIWRCGFRNYRR